MNRLAGCQEAFANLGEFTVHSRLKTELWAHITEFVSTKRMIPLSWEHTQIISDRLLERQSLVLREMYFNR